MEGGEKKGGLCNCKNKGKIGNKVPNRRDHALNKIEGLEIQ